MFVAESKRLTHQGAKKDHGDGAGIGRPGQNRDRLCPSWMPGGM